MGEKIPPKTLKITSFHVIFADITKKMSNFVS